MTGTWRLTAARYVGGADVSEVNVPDGVEPRRCDADVHNLSHAPQQAGIELWEGGLASATNLKLTSNLTFLESCAEPIFNSTCEGLRIGASFCTEACGVCDCPAESELLSDKIWGWDVDGSTLRLSAPDLGFLFEYCVTGEELRLRRQTFELELQRVPRVHGSVCTGTPRPCTEYGVGECSSATGCSLEAGCDGAQRCVGTPAPCSSYSALACPQHLGCALRDPG